MDDKVKNLKSKVNASIAKGDFKTAALLYKEIVSLSSLQVNQISFTSSLAFSTNSNQQKSAAATTNKEKAFKEKSLRSGSNSSSIQGSVWYMTADDWSNYGSVLAETGDMIEARKAYEEALKLNPSHFETIANIAFLDLESINSITNPSDIAEAKKSCIKWFKRALEINPEWLDGIYNSANILAEIGPEYESEALQFYERAIYFLRKRSNQNSKLNQESEKSAKEFNPFESPSSILSQDLETAVDVYNNFAIALANAGRLADALSSAKIAVNLNKNNSNSLINLSELLNRSGNTDFAVACGKKALASDPKNLKGLMLLASILEQTEPKESRSYYHRAIEIDPENLLCRFRLISMYHDNDSPNEEDLSKEMKLKLDTIQFYRAKFSKTDPIGCDLLQFLFSSEIVKAVNPSFLTFEKYSSLPLSKVSESLILHYRARNSSSICNKIKLASLLKHATTIASPETFEVRSFSDIKKILQNERQLLSSSASSGETMKYYLKDPTVQRGQGVYIITDEDVENRISELKSIIKDPFPYVFCLQKSVEPLVLIDGRKFGLRIHGLYISWGNGIASVFVLNDSILTKCWNAYDAKSNDPLENITCTSVQRSQTGFRRDLVKGSASSLWGKDPYLTKCLPLIEKSVFESLKLAVNYGGMSARRGCITYHLFGYDYLVRSSNKTNEKGEIEQIPEPVLIEINSSPQFNDSKDLEDLRGKVAIPLINGLPSIIFSGYEQRETFKNENPWHFCGDIKET